MVSRVDQSETGLLVTINVVMESLEVLKIVLTDDNKNAILKHIACQTEMSGNYLEQRGSSPRDWQCASIWFSENVSTAQLSGFNGSYDYDDK
jgi:hypothetical protein